jgi:hypothetical protein
MENICGGNGIATAAMSVADSFVCFGGSQQEVRANYRHSGANDSD